MNAGRAPGNKQRIALGIVAVLLVGCAAAPAPTPEIIVKTIEVPGPQPTPHVITNVVEREVEVAVPVTPKVCLDALAASDRVVGDFFDWLTAFGDGAYKKASRITDRTGTDLDAYWINRDKCRAGAEVGS